MKKYVIKPGEDGKNSIYERDTNSVIVSNLPIATARQQVSKLNGGCGFRGWTPTFVINSLKKASK